MNILHRLLAVFASLIGWASYADVPGTPSGLSGLTATGLRRIAWEKRLRRDSIKPSVFSALKSAIKVVGNTIQTVKSGVFMEIAKEASDGQTVRVGMAKPLTKAPQWGSSAVLGNEDEQSLVYTQLYYNEVKKGVKYHRWGYNYNDTKYLNFLESNTEALTEYMGELRDMRIHQAMTLTYAEELWNAPVSVTPLFNKNWIIPNLADGSYPSWDNTSMTQTDGSADSDNYYNNRTWSGATTFVENICAALLSASGTGSTSKAKFTVDFWTQLSHYLADRLVMKPVMLDGQPTYIVLVPSNVWAWAQNPNNSGSHGEVLETVGGYLQGIKREVIPGEIGRACGNLLFFKNMKAPTLTVGGAAGSYTIKMGWQRPGNNDDRNNADWSNTSGSTNYVFDMCYVLGENGLCEWVVDELNSKLFEQTEYGQIEGNAAYTGSGIQIPVFDVDAASQTDGASTTQIQRNCACVPISRCPVATIV